LQYNNVEIKFAARRPPPGGGQEVRSGGTCDKGNPSMAGLEKPGSIYVIETCRVVNCINQHRGEAYYDC